MVVNTHIKYLYIDVPKTATTATQKWLMNNDPNARKKISDNSKLASTHVRYVSLENELGKELKEYKTIAVVRETYDRVYSAYNFYKKGAKKKLINSSRKQSFMLKLKIFIAKILPFWLWALVYPIKQTSHFIKSKDDSIKIDYLIDFKSFNNVLPIVLRQLGLDIEESISKTNVSRNSELSKNHYSFLSKKILKYKYGKEKEWADSLEILK